MDTRALTYFRTVVELGTISKAAGFLRIAQPALGRHIQKLETALGVKLLERRPKGVVPTSAGKLLLERTIRLESDLASIYREVSNTAANANGELVVAVQTPLSILLMPDLARAYLDAHPHVLLRAFEGASSEVIDELLSSRIDVAIIDTPTHTPRELRVEPLWLDCLHLYGPISEERNFKAKSVALGDVMRLPLILPSQRNLIRRLIDTTAAREKLRVSPLMEANGPSMIFEMVKRGVGYTIMPAFAVGALFGAGRMFSRPVTPLIDRPVSIVTRTEVTTDRKVGTFVFLFKAAVRRLPVEGNYGSIRLSLPSAGEGDGSRRIPTKSLSAVS